MSFTDRRYAVLGLIENLEMDIIRESIMVTEELTTKQRKKLLSSITKNKERIKSIKNTFPEYFI